MAWDDVEKRQFRIEFLKYGRGKWKEIADGIPMKSRGQVQSYAFRMARDRSAEMEELVRLYEANEDKVVAVAEVGEGHWDNVEKEQFRIEFLKYGPKWRSIAEGIPTRSYTQVKS